MKNKLADIQLAIVAVIWGTGFVAAQIALDSKLTPYQVMAFRFLISTLLLGFIFYKENKRIKLADLKAGIVIGLFLFLAFAFQTVGLKYTTPSKNAFLTAVNVVLVPFLYWITVKKRPDIYSFSGAFLTLIGISFLTLDGKLTPNFGDFLTLLCALGFAMHIVAVGHYSKKHSPIILTSVQMGVACILSFAAMFLTDGLPHLTIKGSMSVLYLGIFSTTIAFLLQNIAQKNTTETKAAVILCTESLFGSLFSVIFLGEVLSPKMIIGCMIIFAAIIITETKLEFLKSYTNNVKGEA